MASLFYNHRFAGRVVLVFLSLFLSMQALATMKLELKKGQKKIPGLILNLETVKESKKAKISGESSKAGWAITFGKKKLTQPDRGKDQEFTFEVQTKKNRNEFTINAISPAGNAIRSTYIIKKDTGDKKKKKKGEEEEDLRDARTTEPYHFYAAPLIGMEMTRFGTVLTSPAINESFSTTGIWAGVDAEWEPVKALKGATLGATIGAMFVGFGAARTLQTYRFQFRVNYDLPWKLINGNLRFRVSLGESLMISQANSLGFSPIFYPVLLPTIYYFVTANHRIGVTPLMTIIPGGIAAGIEATYQFWLGNNAAIQALFGFKTYNRTIDATLSWNLNVITLGAGYTF